MRLSHIGVNNMHTDETLYAIELAELAEGKGYTVSFPHEDKRRLRLESDIEDLDVRVALWGPYSVDNSKYQAVPNLTHFHFCYYDAEDLPPLWTWRRKVPSKIGEGPWRADPKEGRHVPRG